MLKSLAAVAPAGALLCAAQASAQTAIANLPAASSPLSATAVIPCATLGTAGSTKACTPAQIAAAAGALQASNNLSDLGSAATARTSLGLGSAATQASSAFDAGGAAASAQAASLQKSSNLSDLASAAGARTSLGLGGLALLSSLPCADLPALTGDVTSTAGGCATTLAASGVAAGTFMGGTVNAKGLVTAVVAAPTSAPLIGTTSAGAPQAISLGGGLSESGTTLTLAPTSAQITAGLGYTPLNPSATGAQTLAGTYSLAVRPTFNGYTPWDGGNLGAASAGALGLVKPDGTTLTNASGAISVTYGASANTAAQGNDSRITGALAATTASTTYAPLASPVLSGAPKAVTAAAGDATVQIATDAFVSAAVAAAVPQNAWTTYSVTAGSGSGTLGSYTATGRYWRSGKTCAFQVNIKISSAGSSPSSGVLFSIPFEAASAATGVYSVTGLDQATAYTLSGVIGAGAYGGIAYTYSGGTPSENGANISLTGVYETQ